jgi:hypothetical protein
MKIRKRFWLVAACAVAATPFLSTAVSAEGFDGSSDIVCSVKDVVGCVEGAGCMQGRADSFDLPSFFVLDAKKKVMRGSYESGNEAVSPVKNMERNGNHLVLQGVENSRGWDIAINAKTGLMSAAVVGDAISFLVFGACTAP